MTEPSLKFELDSFPLEDPSTLLLRVVEQRLVVNGPLVELEYVLEANTFDEKLDGERPTFGSAAEGERYQRDGVVPGRNESATAFRSQVNAAMRLDLPDAFGP